MMNTTNVTNKYNPKAEFEYTFKSPVPPGKQEDNRQREMAKINPYLPVKNRKKAIAEIEAFMG